MSMNRDGRPTTPAMTDNVGTIAELQTFSGNRGLDIEEPLIFEIGSGERTGADFPAPEPVASRLGGLERSAPIGLPGLTEPETVRHYVRLSRRNYAIDSGIFPLGSCTMKHNPAAQRENGAPARICRRPPVAAGKNGIGCT